MTEIGIIKTNMLSKENVSLKKQLLESKATIAELQFENQTISERIIELETVVINHKEENKSLINTRQSFQTGLNLEKERILKETETRIEKATDKIREMEKEERNLRMINDCAQKTIDAQRIQLNEYQQKFTEILQSKNEYSEIDIQSLFNHEFQEKERLNKVILEQTRLLNDLQTIKNGLVQENQKFREHFGIPTNFGHFTLEGTKINNLTKIEYLESEIEKLEEERAELRCKLRQMASMINPREWDNDVFANLSSEQKELICLYAVNLLNGKNEVYLTDKSKEYLRKCETLEVENDILKRNNENQQKALLNLSKAFQNPIGDSIRHKFEDLLPENKPLSNENFEEEHFQNEKEKNSENFSKKNESLEKNDKNSSKKIKIDQNHENISKNFEEKEVLIEIFECLMNEIKEVVIFEEENIKNEKSNSENNNPEHLKTNYNEKDVKLFQSSKESHFPGSLVAKSKQVLCQIRLLKQQLIEKDKIIQFQEVQCVNIRTLIENSALSQTQQYTLLKENALCQQSNIHNTHENESYKIKLDHCLSMLRFIKNECEKITQESQRKTEKTNKKTEEALKLISDLNKKSSESVSLDDFQKIVNERTELRQKNLELSESVLLLQSNSLLYSNLIPEFIFVLSKLKESCQNEFNLACELKIVQEILSSKDQHYLNFKSLMKRLAECLKIEGILRDVHPLDCIEKIPGNVISEQSLKAIVESAKMHFSNVEYQLLTDYLLLDSDRRIFKNDLMRKLRLCSEDLIKKDCISQTHLSNLLRKMIEKTNLGVEDLFKLFDTNCDGSITVDDILSVLRELNIIEKSSNREKFILEEFFFTFSKKINLKYFMLAFRDSLAQQVKTQTIFGSNNSIEMKIANVLNEFLLNMGFGENGESKMFNELDIQRKGFLNFKDFETFFIEKAQMSIEKYDLEKLYSSIDKENQEDRVSVQTFSNFLQNARLLELQNRQNELHDNPKIKKKDLPFQEKFQMNFETSAKLRLDLVENEKKSLEFINSQQSMILGQLKEQIVFLENKQEENLRLVNLYKQEIDRNISNPNLLNTEHLKSDELALKAINNAHQTESPLKKVEEEKNNKNLLGYLQKEIQNLKVELAVSEQEKLEMFKTAASIAAKNGIEIFEIIRWTEIKSREVLLLNTIKNKDEEIEIMSQKIDHFQAKWIEEKMEHQSIIDALCQKMNLMQVDIANFNSNRLLLVDLDNYEHLMEKNTILQEKLLVGQEKLNSLLKNEANLKLEHDNLRVEYQYSLKHIRLQENDSPDFVKQQLFDAMENAKCEKLEKIKLDKLLNMEKANQKINELKLDNCNSQIEKLEKNLEKQIVKNQEREIFWSANYQKVLSANAIIQQTSEKYKKLNKNDPKFNELAENKLDHQKNNQKTQNIEDLNQMNIQNNEHEFMSQIRTLLTNNSEDNQTKNLFKGSQQALSMMNDLLKDKQIELDTMSKEITDLKLENEKKRVQILQLNGIETNKNKLQTPKNIFGESGKINFNNDHKTALFKSLENQKSFEKSSKIEIEALKNKEKELEQELEHLQKINHELLLKLKDLPKINEQQEIERESFERIRQDLEQKNQFLEDKIKKKTQESQGLLETIRALKTSLVEQSQTSVIPKPMSADWEKVKDDFECKLKISAKKIKELSIKLNENFNNLQMAQEQLKKKDQMLDKMKFETNSFVKTIEKRAQNSKKEGTK